MSADPRFAPAALPDPPPLARVRGEQVSHGQFLAEAHALARTWPDRRYAINLCEDRYHFCLAFAACLLRGLVMLLPPDRGARYLKRLGEDYPGALPLTDRPREYLTEAQAVSRPPVAGPVQGWLDIDPGQPALVAFTSGSTGAPRAHAKTWGSLCESARLIDAQLGGLRGRTIIATVPPQHMYGLELSILQPLCRGAILDAGRPFYPADIAAALASAPAPRLLVTTPIHLRALIGSGQMLPPLDLLVSATAPLDSALALGCEERFQAPLQEIYGCTEAGSIAGRRTATDEPWRLYNGIDLRQAGERSLISAPYLPEPVELQDALRVLDERRFLIEGRAADIINIAGKRGSLAALNQALLDIEGVVDGAFFLPDADESATRRLSAVVVAPTLGNADILARLRRELDPAFLPRTLHRVAALPRNDTGKLTQGALSGLVKALDR